MSAIEDAREARQDRELDTLLAKKLEGVDLATVGPVARVKLRNILKHYAKEPHPFRACVKDNMKRFGPGRTEAVCATLKSTIKSTTQGRSNTAAAKLSEDQLALDGQVLLAIDHISEVDLQEIFMEARALEEHQTVEAVSLLNTTGAAELLEWGDRQ